MAASEIADQSIVESTELPCGAPDAALPSRFAAPVAIGECGIDLLKLAGIDVGMFHNPVLSKLQGSDSLTMGGMSIDCPAKRREGSAYKICKQVMDVSISAALLVLLSPLLVVIALLIRIDSPGPALFRQERVGKNGKLFPIYKFRTMYASTPKYGRSPTKSNDWRITRIGRALRGIGLDELPQLFNVLLGNMSLVGPRPEMPFIVDEYTAQQRRRLDVTPGLTGLWQLSADRGSPIHENMHYDLYYIRHQSIWMDLAILLHTVMFVLRGGV
jgi:lipopolysaccharide/colanic/teichoic acid biosynthesis glycosyltransferase